MATVTFYEDDDCKGNQRSFSGYQQVNDLAEYHYDNSSQEMDDSINSLITGANTWICLFSQHNFQGDTIKFGPNTPINNLHDYSDDAGFEGFRNTIVSFVMYESQPIFWDTSDSHAANGCWLKLYSSVRFTGNEFYFKRSSSSDQHTNEVINMKCISNFEFYDSAQNYHHYYPKSLTTGPDTWVYLFDDINFQNKIAQFGPDSIVSNLSKYGSTSVESLQVFDTAPTDWQGSTNPTPNMVLTIEKHQTGQAIESVLSSALGLIPEVGGIASGLLDALWPSGPDVENIWNSLDSYMNSLVSTLLIQSDIADLNKKIKGIGIAIDSYNELKVPSQQKANKLADILTILETDQPYFFNSKNPEQNLNYLLEFGTISILMLAEQVYNYPVLSGGGTDANAAKYSQNLTDTINALTAAVPQAKATAVAWRVSQITVNEHGSISTNYTLSDAYNGYSVEYSNQSDANNAKTKMVNQVTTQYNILLDAKISTYYLWKYLLPSNTKQVVSGGSGNFPTITFNNLPTQQMIVASTGSFGTNIGNHFIDDCNGHRIRGVNLYSANNLLSGIQWLFDGQSSGIHGSVGTANLQIVFDQDEYITSIYGGNGSYVDQFFIRTNKGRDFGVGGSGGSIYVSAPPQGVNAQIVSIEGYTNTSTICQLTINWSYQVWR